MSVTDNSRPILTAIECGGAVGIDLSLVIIMAKYRNVQKLWEVPYQTTHTCVVTHTRPKASPTKQKQNNRSRKTRLALQTAENPNERGSASLAQPSDGVWRHNLGNRNKFTPSAIVLEKFATPQRFGITTFDFTTARGN